jgi:hypothetical protein
MAKGQSKAADTNLATTNSVAAGQGANASQIFGTAAPLATNLATNGGYTPAQQTGIVNSGVNAANSVFGSAADAARTGAGTTRNAAGLDTTLDSMARGKSAADATAAQTAQTTIANDQQSQRQLGLQDLNSLYGTTTGSMNSLYGLGPGTLQARAAGQNPGLAIAQSLIGAAGGAGAAYAGK